MIYITQLIYVFEGQEQIFHEFESVAIPIILKYNGKLLLRIRPTEGSFIETNMERPYEIHLVSFDSEHDFENFKQDDERKEFLNLRNQSIKTSIIIQGIKL